MSTEVPAAAAEAAPTPAPAREPLLARIGDRLNPILVREVQQALYGKGFLATAGLALLAVTIIALVVASQDEVSPREGANFFAVTLMVLIPILFFIVPFQAFLSMRSEVGGGTVEHLLMSRLSPGAIVRGKLVASVVQFVIYLAIFAPLLAMTFLLRGVDIPTIGVSLLLLFVFAVGCSAVGVSCGALCRWRSFFRVVPFAIVLLGLGGFTWGSMAVAEDFSREIRRAFANESATHYLSMFLVPCAGGIVLCSLVGSAMLAHPYENRSSAFRVFALAGVLIAFIVVLYNDHHLHALPKPPSHFDLGQNLAAACILAGVTIGLVPFFAATEAPRLTRRVAGRVPRNPVLAALVTPLLPGLGRGALFATLLAAMVFAALAWIPPLWGGTPADTGEWSAVQGVWLYVLLISFLGAVVRGMLGSQGSRNWAARAVLPGFLFLGVILPLIWGAMGGAITSRTWNPLFVFNPFITLESLSPHRGNARLEILGWLWALTLVCFVINLVPMFRGVLEVQRASAARRQRGD